MWKPRTQLKTRDLMIGLVIVGLMLGHAAHLFRTEPKRPRLRIRVFNKTTETIQDLKYEWISVAQHIESYGEHSGSVELAPGAQMSFNVALPGPVDITLSCATSNGGLTSDPIRVELERGDSGSLDVYVRPSGVKASLVRSNR
jgi:hypothetical protein